MATTIRTTGTTFRWALATSDAAFIAATSLIAASVAAVSMPAVSMPAVSMAAVSLAAVSLAADLAAEDLVAEDLVAAASMAAAGIADTPDTLGIPRYTPMGFYRSFLPGPPPKAARYCLSLKFHSTSGRLTE